MWRDSNSYSATNHTHSAPRSSILLLAAPAGARATMGLDPGYRTGVKVAVVSGTGQVAATTTIYPHEPQRRWDEATLNNIYALLAFGFIEQSGEGSERKIQITEPGLRSPKRLIMRYADNSWRRRR